MQAFQKHTGIAALLPEKNIDTDQIIPARFLKLSRGNGLDKALFHDFRFDAQGNKTDFILNIPPFDQTSILVVGDNFGCGSSREAAVYALAEFGIRALVGTRFGDIFHNNCMKNGILPIRLTAEQIELITQQLKSGSTQINISLPEQVLSVMDTALCIPFHVDPFWKNCLLQGMDDLSLTLTKMAEIADFEKNYWQRFPWQHLNSTRQDISHEH